MSFIAIIQAVELAFEIYKELKGKSHEERDKIKAQILNRLQQVQSVEAEVKKTGDASKVEDILSGKRSKLP